jgi:NAD(P)H dehydrogenase (quinone)
LARRVKMRVLVLYYSMYGHVRKMAEAVAEGARQVKGAEVIERRVPETLSEEILGKMGAIEAQKSMAHVPICTLEDLEAADAILFGTPTRFGNMCGQMRQFLDATGKLWAKGTGGRWSVFTSPLPSTGAGVDDSEPHRVAHQGSSL